MRSDFSPELRDAISKMARYCSLQERCQSQVQQKLMEMTLSREDQDQVLRALEAEDFLNEERFARAYATGKFRQLKWGKMKIVAGLRFLRVSNSIIQEALHAIDPVEYERVRLQLIEKKKKMLKEKDIFRIKSKIAHFLHAKGFESNDLPSLEGPE